MLFFYKIILYFTLFLLLKVSFLKTFQKPFLRYLPLLPSQITPID